MFIILKVICAIRLSRNLTIFIFIRYLRTCTKNSGAIQNLKKKCKRQNSLQNNTSPAIILYPALYNRTEILYECLKMDIANTAKYLELLEGNGDKVSCETLSLCNYNEPDLQFEFTVIMFST